MFSGCRKAVESCDIKGGNYEYLESIFNFHTTNRGGAFTSPYLNRNNEVCSFLVMPTALAIDDESIIHEFNHIIELDILKETEKGVDFKCGFDILAGGEFPNKDLTEFTEDTLKPMNQVIDDGLRRYEKFNEVINDKLSLEICEQMHIEGLKLTGYVNPEGTTYSRAFALLNPHIQENKDLIVKSRLSKDPFAYGKMIGKDNYHEMADLTTKYLTPAALRSFLSFVSSSTVIPL